MHRSGLAVTAELKAAFLAAQENQDSHYLKIEIRDDSYVLVSKGNSQGDNDANFAACAKEMADEQPSYFVCRAPKFDDDASKQNRWFLLFYMPEDSQVRDKMLYASSSSSLKDGLGAANFLCDMHIGERSESTMRDFMLTRKVEAGDEVLTMDELTKKESEQASMMSMSHDAHKMTAMSDIPIKVSDGAQAALNKIKAASTGTAIFSLDPKTEVLHAEESGDNMSMAEVAAAMPADAGRYVISRYVHDKGTSNVFIYYCPDLAPPRAKMTYSTCKSFLLKLLVEHDIASDKNIEASEPAEISDDVVLKELFPPAAVVTKFSKPKMGGASKGKSTKSKFRGNKFSSNITAPADDD